jgi:hypothetical protein
MPDVPQIAAGMRMEPPVSDPSAANASRAATALPEPLDDPPVTCAVFQGLRQCPKWALWPVGLKANSAMLSVPISSAPAASSRCSTVAVCLGVNVRRICEPQVETRPAR